jgi:ATP-dependent DNA helicase PIF1
MFQDHPIEINEPFKKALALMEETDRSVFITGKAGTGKSTLLTYFRKVSRKRLAVLAPTGVAAVNVQGQTIHSFCGFKPDISLEKVKKLSDKNKTAALLYKKLDTLIIDEISMVRADLLDCLEKFLRLNGPRPRKPFGGIQMIFIGDLYQLPPVVTSLEQDLFKLAYETPYFFSAHIFADPKFKMDLIELEKIYRQTDQDFILLLNAIRNRSVSEEDLVTLNSRHVPDFNPQEGDYAIYLTSTNAQALKRNQERLDGLPGRHFQSAGFLEGNFDASALPTEKVLELKPGAQVMLLSNDPFGRWVNGSLGKIIRLPEQAGAEEPIQVELDDHERVQVTPYTWEIFHYSYDARSLSIFSEAVGAFTQYPLKLAWAITIHKSQGKTFPKAVIDIGRGTFAHGQVYVALSRCTHLAGVTLSRPIQKHHILMDRRVVTFLTQFQYRKSEEAMGYDEKVRFIREALENNRNLDIVYLKPDDTKSRRRIRPEAVERMEYRGREFEGLRAFCYERQDQRHFRIDRILELKDCELPSPTQGPEKGKSKCLKKK